MDALQPIKDSSHILMPVATILSLIAVTALLIFSNRINIKRLPWKRRQCAVTTTPPTDRATSTSSTPPQNETPGSTDADP